MRRPDQNLAAIETTDGASGQAVIELALPIEATSGLTKEVSVVDQRIVPRGKRGGLIASAAERREEATERAADEATNVRVNDRAGIRNGLDASLASLVSRATVSVSAALVRKGGRLGAMNGIGAAGEVSVEATIGRECANPQIKRMEI